MSTLSNKVREALESLPRTHAEDDAALKEAERLSDIYADIKPVPYVVPIQRWVGLLYNTNNRKIDNN